MTNTKQSRIGQRGASNRQTNDLRCAIYDWSKKTGRDSRDWWNAAQGDGLTAGCGHKVVMKWFREQLAR